MHINYFQAYSFLFLFAVVFHCPTVSQTNYFNQDLPGLQPQIFAPGLISKTDRYEFGSIFSKDGSEFYFAINNENRSEILGVQRSNGVWGDPKTIISHPRFGFNDPFLSPDENRLYYISDMTKGSYDESIDHDIWYSERVGTSWSEPINAGEEINSEFNEYYISFTGDGAMYFSSNKKNAPDRNHDFDIYKSKSINEIFQPAHLFGDSINTSSYEADVFIAPDESYIIFVSFKKEGKGQGDLYISFKDANGLWSKAKNMGSRVNTENHELCPFVSIDGKYLFYTSNEDIYWVSTDVFEQLR